MFASPLLHDLVFDLDDDDDMGFIYKSRAALGSHSGSRSDKSHKAAYGSEKLGDAARTPSSSSDGAKTDSSYVNGPPPYVEGDRTSDTKHHHQRSEKPQHPSPDNNTQQLNEKPHDHSNAALATASKDAPRGRRHWKAKLHQRGRSSSSASTSSSSSSGSSMSLHSLRNKIRRKINGKMQRRFGRL